MLLDGINYEIVKILESSQQPFYVGELKERLDAIGMSRSKPTLIRRLKDLEDMGWIKRVVHGSYEHVKWEPYSPRFYQRLLQHREIIIDTVTNLKAEAMVAQIVPEAEKTYHNLRSYKLEDPSERKTEKIKKTEQRLRELLGWLLRDFDKLDELSKMRMFKWAYESKYFENLTYS
ncbi:hypothetical protein [Candidatus Nitrosotenuis aquarius]|uniref:hypothetical protein n=1 Tax=Candidatus Nitrosotenuis aquarius TaxID=1846278 RepID=UPI0013C2C224|nr:hypothetical protein [Candidatus Nitrosotenuis aquarius]